MFSTIESTFGPACGTRDTVLLPDRQSSPARCPASSAARSAPSATRSRTMMSTGGGSGRRPRASTRAPALFAIVRRLSALIAYYGTLRSTAAGCCLQRVRIRCLAVTASRATRREFHLAPWRLRPEDTTRRDAKLMSGIVPALPWQRAVHAVQKTASTPGGVEAGLGRVARRHGRADRTARPDRRRV